MTDQSPRFRATVAPDGSIRLAKWRPWYSSGVLVNGLLTLRTSEEVGIADLSVLRDASGRASEVVAAFVCGDTDPHRDSLEKWAASVGYTRLWLSDAVRELAPGEWKRAMTHCAACHVRLVDGGDEFWEFVRRTGAFPNTCGLCGASVPQWTPIETNARLSVAAPLP